MNNHLVMVIEEVQNYTKNNQKCGYAEQLWWRFTASTLFFEKSCQQNYNISQAKAGLPAWRGGISLPRAVVAALNGKADAADSGTRS